MRPQVPYSSGLTDRVIIIVKIIPVIIDKTPPTNDINPL
jgi:hypothetical protein